MRLREIEQMIVDEDKALITLLSILQIVPIAEVLKGVILRDLFSTLLAVLNWSVYLYAVMITLQSRKFKEKSR